MSTNNQKYVKTVAKVCRKKSINKALKSMSKTSKSMSLHTEYVKSSLIFLMRASGVTDANTTDHSSMTSPPTQCSARMG